MTTRRSTTLTRLGPDHAARLAAADRRLGFAVGLLDDLIEIPGTGRRFGLDPILGLIPWIGDLIPAAVGAWIVAEAIRFPIPKVVVARMVVNVAIDFAIGIVPVVGDLFDFAFKSNEMNLALFRRHASDPGADTSGHAAFLAGLLLILAGIAWLALVALQALLSIRIG